LREADAHAEEKLQRAYEVLDQAVNDHAFPGGVLAVGYQDELIVTNSAGKRMTQNRPPSMWIRFTMPRR